MASDIVLVLRSEHRELSALADQCSRMSRGFEDPARRLGNRMRAHAAALDRNVVGHSLLASDVDGIVREILERLRTDLEFRQPDEAAGCLVAREAEALLPRLEREVPLTERRRMGKGFRLVRDAALRGSPTTPRRVRSQSELYEVARRAGLERRSRMSLVELQRAVEAWEREALGHG